MVLGQKPIGVIAPNPGISPEIEGAPASIPGGNDGTDKTKMSGTPVASASVPHSVSSDLAGAPQAGQVVQSVNTAPSDDNGGETKAVPATDTDPAPTTPTDDERAKAEAVAGIDRKIAAWRKYYEALPEPETKEQRAKREKLEKSKRIIGAVSDGLRAMSNLWFTTKYAPNMYDHENESQLKATNQWIDKAKADREKLRDEHLRFAIGLGDAENERAKTLRELESEQEKREIARNKADQDNQRFEWEKALQGDKQAEQKSKTKKAQHEAEIAETKSEYEPLQQEADLKKKGAQTNASNASAANSYASAQEKWNKGVVFMGKRYNDSNAYKKAVTRYAKDLGIPLQKDQDKIGRDRVGKPAIVKVKVNRSVEDLASEVERRVEQKNREMTAPHKRKNNNSKPPTRR